MADVARVRHQGDMTPCRAAEFTQSKTLEADMKPRITTATVGEGQAALMVVMQPKPGSAGRPVGLLGWGAQTNFSFLWPNRPAKDVCRT